MKSSITPGFYNGSKRLKHKYIGYFVFWYHLYNLKDVKNTNGGVLLLVKLQALLKCFSHFLNCTNDTKLRKVSHMTIFSASTVALHLLKCNSIILVVLFSFLVAEPYLLDNLLFTEIFQ